MPRNSSILLRAVQETVSNTPTFACRYCPRTFESERARSVHISRTPECQSALEAHSQRQRLDLTARPLCSTRLEQERTLVPPRVFEPQQQPTQVTSSDSQPLPRSSSTECPSPSEARRFPKPWVEEVEDEDSQRNYSGWDERTRTFVDRFPDPAAGAPISDEYTYQFNLHSRNQASGPLADPDTFEIAELLMTTSLTNVDRDRFLRSKLFQGRTPWLNSYQLLADIDGLPHGPEWEAHEITIDEGNEVSKHIVYGRNIIQIVRELIGNPEWKDEIKYAPEWHSIDKEREVRVYGEMWTARWWWRLQMVMAGKGRVTITPLIAMSDRTNVATLLGGQQAYPVYITIGNISKSTRRKTSEHATVLLGYLPVEQFKHVAKAKDRARLKAELLHRSMEILMAPLKTASRDGVEMWCADGRLRRVYPILAAFVGDWPEQNDMACTEEGGCPVCMTAYKGRGSYHEEWPMRYGEETIAAWDKYNKEGGSVPLEDLGTRPCRPWWADLSPEVNFHACIAPDLLHQLHQGIFKTHLKKWALKLIGAETVDDCFRAMPTTQGMRHFLKGVSKVKNWTGKESKQMASQLLPVVIGQTDSSFELLARVVLDFIHRTHALRMTEVDIQELQDTLRLLHDVKGALVELGVYATMDHFDRVPKLHMIIHYPRSIRELGTPDGYNSELPESLHITLAKIPWRRSNKVNPIPQMAKLIQRLEAIRKQRTYLNQRYGLQQRCDASRWENEGGGGVENEGDGFEEPDQEGEDWVPTEQVGDSPLPHIGLAKVETKDQTGSEMVASHGMTNLLKAIGSYANRRLNVRYDSNQLTLQHRFKIWHRFYLHHRPLQCAPADPPFREVIRARPASSSHLYGRKAFDSVLFVNKPEAHGIHRYRAGRVRAIFAVPAHMQRLIPGVLVYLELFSTFNIKPSVFHQLHATSPARNCDHTRSIIVLPITDIVLGCHLVPEFQYLVETYHLNAQTDSLTLGKRFYLNHYANYYIFQLMEHWRREGKSKRTRDSSSTNVVGIMKRR